MVQSLELVLDEALDGLVRGEWTRLAEAGLPSQARHAGASNAPHVTVGVADEVVPAVDEALAQVTDPTGMAVVLGGWLVFAGRRHVLARSVVPSAELLALQAEVAAALGDAPGRPTTTAVGRWTPHVTIARHLDGEQLAAAMRALGDSPRELEGSVAGLRRWDSVAARTWRIGARVVGGGDH